MGGKWVPFTTVGNSMPVRLMFPRWEPTEQPWSAIPLANAGDDEVDGNEWTNYQLVVDLADQYKDTGCWRLTVAGSGTLVSYRLSCKFANKGWINFFPEFTVDNAGPRDEGRHMGPFALRCRKGHGWYKDAGRDDWFAINYGGGQINRGYITVVKDYNTHAASCLYFDQSQSSDGNPIRVVPMGDGSVVEYWQGNRSWFDVTLNSFECREQTGDGSPHDEIYFTYSATDGRSKVSETRTDTYEDLESGDFRQMKQKTNTTLWSGPFPYEGAAFTLACFEEDHGEWDKSLALVKKWLDEMFPDLQKRMDPYAIGMNLITFWMSDAASLAISYGSLALQIWENLKAGDDIVGQHSFCLTGKDFPDEDFKPTYKYFDFNGNDIHGSGGWGKYRLCLKLQAHEMTDVRRLHEPLLGRIISAETGQILSRTSEGDLTLHAPGEGENGHNALDEIFSLSRHDSSPSLQISTPNEVRALTLTAEGRLEMADGMADGDEHSWNTRVLDDGSFSLHHGDFALFTGTPQRPGPLARAAETTPGSPGGHRWLLTPAKHPQAQEPEASPNTTA
ncbi:hypothetical protein ACWDWU_30135 [Streptomyces sp. NPDC003442]